MLSISLQNTAVVSEAVPASSPSKPSRAWANLVGVNQRSTADISPTVERSSVRLKRSSRGQTSDCCEVKAGEPKGSPARDSDTALASVDQSSSYRYQDTPLAAPSDPENPVAAANESISPRGGTDVLAVTVYSCPQCTKIFPAAYRSVLSLDICFLYLIPCTGTKS